MDESPPDPALAGSRHSRIKRMINRLVAVRDETEQPDSPATSAERPVPIARVRDREETTVSGTLRAVTVRPRAGIPALEAELYDGSGTLAIVWLGRRQIGGIEPGRALVARGRVAVTQGRPVMFNPRYELRPAGAA
jgi:hypothetical protein